jgi:hypothetical protein
MKKLTWENLESTVRELALADPEYVDPRTSATATASGSGGCKYTPDGSYKGCIIGQALTKLGATPLQLKTIEGDTPRNARFAEVFGLPREVAGIVSWNANTHPTAIALGNIQSRQDNGWDWESCVS